MTGSPYLSREKSSFFGGLEKVSFPEFGENFEIYKVRNRAAFNKAVFVNAY